MAEPLIILVEPQMGENIGAAARAMLNCGLQNLRIVRPRDGWPSERAEAMSAGALTKMPPVQVFESTAEAVADCHYVYATTARPRDQVKPVFTAKSAATDMHVRKGQQSAILFGPERAGLSNDDVSLAHAIITIPLNPDYSSLNLAQGVLIAAYEWYQAGDETVDRQLPTGDSAPATHDEIKLFIDRMESELEDHHFFRDENMKPSVVRNLQNMFVRAEMTDQEIRTFHGIVSALTGKKAEKA